MVASSSFRKNAADDGALLTTERLWIPRFRDRSLIGEFSVKLADISGLSVDRVAGGRNGNPQLHLSFWAHGRRYDLLSGNAAHDKAFVDALRRGINRPRGHPGDQLEKLAAMRRQGLLSEGEWTRAKELFLGRPENEREKAMKSLSALLHLHRQGALSESEFNMKKWQILSRPE